MIFSKIIITLESQTKCIFLNLMFIS